jgi:hypothetical protein
MILHVVYFWWLNTYACMMLCLLPSVWHFVGVGSLHIPQDRVFTLSVLDLTSGLTDHNIWGLGLSGLGFWQRHPWCCLNLAK